MDWLCPACGTINRAHITPGQAMRVRCGYMHCSAPFRFSFTLWQQPTGNAEVALDEPFPTAETAFLERGMRYLHRAEELPGAEPGPVPAIDYLELAERALEAHKRMQAIKG